jgi:undecaprenyl-diphosphatase
VIALLLLRRPDLAAIAGLATITRMLNGRIKHLLDSPRPTGEYVRVTEIADGLGFPSGHAMGSTLWYGAIIVIAARLIDARRPRLLVQGAALAIIIATGFGRMYTGAHWPSDVLGGYLWGVILLTAVIAITDRVVKPRPASPVYSRDEPGPRVD